LYILNETQRALYLTDDIVISELSEITSVENTVTTYIQGSISKIEFENGSVISDTIFSENYIPASYLYTNMSDNNEYLVENSKISRITNASGNELIFNDAGFVSSMISSNNEVSTYEYLISDGKAADSIDNFSYNTNEILYNETNVQIDLEFDYGDGSDGILTVESGQTIYVEGTKEFESIYVADGGTLIVNSWDGISGGSVELKVKGTVLIDGIITASGSGYRGGINDPSNSRSYGLNPSGESYEGGFGVDSVAWFQTITKKINLLKEVDDELAKQNTLLLEEVEASSKISITVTLASYSIFAVVIFIIIFLISRGINISVRSSLEKISCVSDNLDLTCDIIVEGKDEISQISKAIKVMIVAFKESVHQAKDVSAATTQESQKLNHVVEDLTRNGEVADAKITNINILVSEVGQRLDAVEEASITVTED